MIKAVDVREFSVAERVAGLGFGVAVAAALWPHVTAATGLAAPCPLRWLTGVPCPACGMTTASVALVRGDVSGALAANPAVFGLAAVAAAGTALLVLRAARVLPAPVPWSARARRLTGWLVVPLALASWILQVRRLGVG
ncbi:MAG TPA: DUF2752 domain-containing protein [Pilimelia sp.]|nr:DUF2752 domain-containing protein [Pilimelia sp.]